MLGHYFGFFHGGLTDLWISRGFLGGRNWGGVGGVFGAEGTVYRLTSGADMLYIVMNGMPLL